MKKLLALIAACIMLTGCSPLEQNARNTAAALQGTIVAAQASMQTSCTANPQQETCVIVNQAINGQAALVTAIEAYCGWSTTNPPADPNATCNHPPFTPVKTEEAALQTAIANATTFITELKGVIK
jgi:hypothetical protein